MSRRSDDVADGRLPDLLTVEEAARLIRVGRTKAYAMAQEWRATGGRSGLPVVDFGHVLRVPRRALEQLIGTELTGPVQSGVAARRAPGPADPVTRQPRHGRPGPGAPSPPPSRRAAQPALFDPPPAS